MLFSSCKKEEKVEKQLVEQVISAPSEVPKKIKIALEPESDKDAFGKVVLKEEDGNITITALVSGLSTGEHPVLVEDIKNAIVKTSIGILIADENGNGTISNTSEFWCFDCEENDKRILGKKIVIYQSDDKTEVNCSGIIE